MLLAEQRVGKLLVDDVLNNEVDQRIGLRIDVVPVEKNLGELQDLAQTPGKRRDVVEQSFVVPERVQSQTLRVVRSEILDFLKRLRLDVELLVECLVRLLELSRLIQIAQVGTFDIEAHRGDRSLVLGEMSEHRCEQPLDGARLGREPRDAGDVEVRCLGP